MKRFISIFLLSLSFFSVDNTNIKAGIIGRTLVQVRHPLAGNNKRYVQDLRVGHKVLTMVEEGDKVNYRRSEIIKITKKIITDIIVVTTDSGQVVVDPDEYFFNSRNKMWTKAKEITEDDSFSDVSMHKIKIKRINRITLKKEQFVYDLTLNNPHIFFICDSSGNSILVHNSPMTIAALYAAYIASLGTAVPIASGTSVITLTTAATGLALSPLYVVAAPAAIAGAAGWVGYKIYKEISRALKHRKNIKRLRSSSYNNEAPEDRIVTRLLDVSPRPDLSEPDLSATFNVIKEAEKEAREIKDLNNGNNRGGPGPEEERKKIEELNYKGREKNSRQLQRAHRSHKAEAEEHIEKLRKYIKEPDKYDNKGDLKNAGSDQLKRAKIIDGRIKHLANEVKTQAQTCKEIERVIQALRASIWL